MISEQQIQEQIQNDGGITVFVYWNEQEQCYTADTANSRFMDENLYVAVDAALEDEIRQRVVQKERAERKS